MTAKAFGRWRQGAAGGSPSLAPSRRGKSWAGIWVMLLVLPLALLAGLVAGTGSKTFFVLVLGMVLAPWVLLMPSTWLLALLLAMATVGAGCLQYFGRISQAHWIPTLLLAVMMLRIPFDALRARSGGDEPVRIGGLSAVLMAFVLVFLASAAINLVAPMQFLVGLRHYVFPLALAVAVVQARADPRFWAGVLRGIPWLMLLQVPLCAYQYLFVERSRSEQAFGAVGISWDAVVGSFGGNPEGGGASGALALFLSFGVAATLVLRRSGLIGRALAAASLLACALCALMAEIKVLVVFLPLALLLVNRQRIFSSPVSLLGWVLSTALLTVVLLQAYNFIHYAKRSGGQSATVAESLSTSIKAERDPRFFNPLTGEVSRGGAVLLWSDYNLGSALSPYSLVGWGPAASKISTLFGVGSAAKGRRFTLTTSTGSQMLWDLGLLGLGLFFAVGGFTVRQGLQQARRWAALPAAGGAPPVQWAVAEVAALGAWLCMAGVFYNGDAINNPAVQVLLALCVGWVLWLHRQPSAAPARSA